MSVLGHDVVRSELRRAWIESQAGTELQHEEGGFVLRDGSSALHVERWPRGLQNSFQVPEHTGGLCGGMLVVATFHTHPNSDASFRQSPSRTDIRAVRLDPDLGHAEYEGEYVISRTVIYRIRRTGDVEVIGDTCDLLQLA